VTGAGGAVGTASASACDRTVVYTGRCTFWRLQHAHRVVHRRADFDALEARDLAEHNFEVVLHLHGSPLPQLCLDCFCVDACDAEAGEDVPHFDRDLVLRVFHAARRKSRRARQVCLFFCGK